MPCLNCYLYCLWAAFLIHLPLNGQEMIRLMNPSFEDIPRAGGQGTEGWVAIEGWYDCGLSAFPGKSPPDIHPHPDAWTVDVEAQDGNTFLGMVVRSDETWEYISDYLNVPMQGGICYEFSIYLSRSEQYFGLRGMNPEGEVYYTRPILEPVILRIWGGKRPCDQSQLLAVSEAVLNHEWVEYAFILNPEDDCESLTLEAYYDPFLGEPYDGHLLLDNASDLVPVSCPR